MNIEEISDILYYWLDDVYCYNCRFERCDECNRKAMGWQISRETCDELAKEILELDKKQR